MTSFIKKLLTLKEEPASLEYMDYGIRLTGIPFQKLAECLGHLPGVCFTSKRPFLLSLGEGEADFTFRDHSFGVETDSRDSALWLVFRNGAWPAEMQELHEHLQRSLSLGPVDVSP